jgi:hypothetical protein
MRLLLLILLFSGAVEGAAAPPLYVRILTPPGIFDQVDVAASTLSPGETQNLYIQLDKHGNHLTILQLVVTYPNRSEEQVLGSTVGAQATLTWPIPPDAGVGMARFTLTSGGCGCGVYDPRQPPSNTESRAEGWFWVKERTPP